MMTSWNHVLSFSGGNALGVFHAGAVQALIERGIMPAHVAGTSIGAITGALWLGGPPEQAVERLTAFWQGSVDGLALGGASALRKASALRALLVGRPALFRPGLPGFLAALPGVIPDDHLFETAPMARLLSSLVDIEALNASPTRLSIVALDQTTGEPAVFDNHDGGLRIEHVLASAALPLGFPPVVIDGRRLVDGGLSENCPVRRLFEPMPTSATRCWVLDPWPLAGAAPGSLDQVLSRGQDLAFASQRAWALRDVRARVEAADMPPVMVHEVLPSGDGWEIGAKAFDYTPAALARRWEAGHAAMTQALDAVDEAAAEPSAPAAAPSVAADA
ncbi:patatin-like phospholipase family protein [Paracoccus contaminans]|nr:patatin-like phospholipase family protein [Paracoccus contaminans]